MPATPPLTYADASALIQNYMVENNTNQVSCADWRALILSLINFMSITPAPGSGFTSYAIADVRAEIDAVFFDNQDEDIFPKPVLLLTQMMLDYWATAEGGLASSLFIVTDVPTISGIVNKHMVDNTANQISASKMRAIYHRWLDMIASIYNSGVTGEHHTDITFLTSVFSTAPLVTSDVSPFVAWIRLDDNRFKSVAHSGHIHFDDGTDIRFTTLGSSANLNWELISYDATTGQLRAFVEIPTEHISEDTAITMNYGSASDFSAYTNKLLHNQWHGYVGVWHNIPTIGSGRAFDDSTPNNNILLDVSDTPASITLSAISLPSGYLTSAWNFDQSIPNRLKAASSVAYNNSKGSWTFWIQPNAPAPGSVRMAIISECTSSASNGLLCWLQGGTIGLSVCNSIGGELEVVYSIGIGDLGINDSAPHFCMIRWDGSLGNYEIYVDNALKASSYGSFPFSFAGDDLYIGSANPALDVYFQPFDGLIWDVQFYGGAELPISDFGAQSEEKNNPGDVGSPASYTVGVEY